MVSDRNEVQLVRLESFIRDAFLKKEHLLPVFFDLEKAYDITWKYGIMKDLHESGLRGHLPNFVSSFFYPIENSMSVLTNLYPMCISRKWVFHKEAFYQ